MYAHWLGLHRENPSQQRYWSTDLYRHLWRPLSNRIERREDGRVAVRAILDIAQAEKVSELEAWCRDQAETVLALHDIEADEASSLRVAKAVAAQVQRASLTLSALARGEPEASSATVRAAVSTAKPSTKAVGLTELVEAWWQEAERTGKSDSTRESYTNAIRQFSAFLGHNEAHRVTVDDVRHFKDHRLASRKSNGQLLSPTTVKNSDLAALKAVFGWGVANGRLTENPAKSVTVAKVTKAILREREFTLDEARALLREASQLKPGRELPQTFAAKRWIPWVLAFTGARVGEIAQMRRQDLRREAVPGHPEGVWVLKITPEAGTVKTKQARDVPLHPQLVELGFPAFVEGTRDERLFLVPGTEGKIEGPLQAVKNRLGEFARRYVDDPGVSPNHSWRHRFRTVATEAGVPGNVIDAICGWSARSVGERYGSVSLKARTDAIMRLPPIAL
ncbi:Tyrosine recombinase XerC [Methylobacterium thuringiense]|uniref:Tyrosine recombinase XerC n=2 Tax=Methylobacterium thuringiense TaxID=1003091 RepID=A0ABQ4TPG1_9HYPH|nr:Tyrosine recombinase XerC [Methylobacterium thuringiense]